jgi:uncharacterized circularly permuted ATP-grasp superfamily protein
VGCELDRYLGDPANLAAARDHLEGELERRHIYFGKAVLPSFPRPDLINAALDREVGAKIERLAAILERVGAQIVTDPELHRVLRCPPGLTALCEIEPNYRRLIVNSRLDMTGPETFGLFEINTDSPAMMTYTDLLEEIMLSMPAIAERLEVAPVRHRLTRGLLDALGDVYREWGGTRDDPTIAIVDWREQKTASELLKTAEVFTELGCPTVVCHPADLSIHDGRLHALGRRIDIVQRRVLFPDFLRRAGELEVLLEAYRRGLVCVANPLRAITIGNKGALALLSERPDLCDLSKSDQEFVREVLPETCSVSAASTERLIAERERWVLKSSLSSGGNGVTLGVEVSDREWRELVTRAADEVVVAQRLQPIAVRQVPAIVDDHVEFHTQFANWNPWIFGGRYGGASTRVSLEKIVSITAGGGLIPSIPI